MRFADPTHGLDLATLLEMTCEQISQRSLINTADTIIKLLCFCFRMNHEGCNAPTY